MPQPEDPRTPEPADPLMPEPDDSLPLVPNDPAMLELPPAAGPGEPAPAPPPAPIFETTRPNTDAPATSGRTPPAVLPPDFFKPEAEQPKPGGSPRPFAGNLTGTVWHVTDSDGEKYTFEFREAGELRYQTGRNNAGSAKWQQEGDKVTIILGAGATTFQGGLRDKMLSGTGSSRSGNTWTWKASPK